MSRAGDALLSLVHSHSDDTVHCTLLFLGLHVSQLVVEFGSAVGRVHVLSMDPTVPVLSAVYSSVCSDLGLGYSC